MPARYLSKLKCSSISIENLKELSERNRWVKRAIDFDIEIIKSRNAKHIDASDVVSNALIKLAGNTLADAAHRPSSNKDAIEKALKLISGYKKLK